MDSSWSINYQKINDYKLLPPRRDELSRTVSSWCVPPIKEKEIHFDDIETSAYLIKHLFYFLKWQGKNKEIYMFFPFFVTVHKIKDLQLNLKCSFKCMNSKVIKCERRTWKFFGWEKQLVQMFVFGVTIWFN